MEHHKVSGRVQFYNQIPTLRDIFLDIHRKIQIYHANIYADKRVLYEASTVPGILNMFSFTFLLFWSLKSMQTLL